MQVATGKSILNGIAIGPLRIYKKVETQATATSTLTPEEEYARFDAARTKAQEELGALYEKALDEVGEDNASIFEIHQMMLDDDDYLDAVKGILDTQGATAEYAVSATGENFAAAFADMEDEYMRARAADVKDISRRVVNVLLGVGDEEMMADQPAILVADDLTPSETVQLDKSKLLGFITRHGSSNSHTAILARTMNIPALVGVDFQDDWDGKLAVIDGYNHCVYIEPAQELLGAMEEKRSNDLKQEALLQSLKKKPNTTLDGKEIKVYANIGNAGDVGLVLQNDAQGIGLFRSEFIYLDSQDYPSEDQQFMLYKRVVETMAGKKVIIRTLDIGADKQAEYFELDKEENPALGYRAIRICLTRKEIFKTQLRAILRASAFGTVSIMFPMIISVREVRDAKEILEECRAELAERGVAYGNVEVGIMVETPAAVLLADELAEEVEFFSLGTNDLTQYTLAIDRQNPKLDNFYDAHHPAVLRMIKHTIEAGHRHGCWVGICGELGADQTLTETFLRYGVDELSVSPAAVLPLPRPHVRKQSPLNFQQLRPDGRQQIGIFIQDAQILFLQRPGPMAGEQPPNGAGHLCGLILELIAEQQPDPLHGKPCDGGRDGDVHSGQRAPDLAAQQLQPLPPSQQRVPVLIPSPTAALPQGGLGGGALRRNLAGDALLLAHFFCENGKGGSHTQPHLPAGLLHAFLRLFVYTEVNHNLSHGLRPLSLP